MRIVHIEDFFHPNAGYQINILPKYMVKQGHSVTIVSSEMEKIPDGLTVFFGKADINKYDDEYMSKTGVSIVRLPLKKFISGRAIFTNELFKKVKDLKPDILYIHGNDTLTAMRYLLKLKKIKIPVVMDSHMLEMASVNKFNKIFRLLYRKVFSPIIVKNGITIIRTQDDEYVEKCLGIPLRQCPWISVGSDTLLFYPDNITKKQFRNNNDIKDEDFVVLYTGKLDESKGGMFLAQAFEKKFNTDRNIVLIVVGNTNGEYGRMVDEVFERSENRIIRFPTQKYMELAKYYQSADLSVFPKQCSLSFYDAQACGLPVLSEDNNINIARLQHNNGFIFKSGDIEEFRLKIEKCAEMLAAEYKKIGDNAFEFVKNNYDYKDIADQYTDVLVDEVGKFGATN
jgi:glycosyltransferase involved in cell wall biosynthesis